jgi:hypothetical protein
MTNQPVIDSNKLAATFGIAWKHPRHCIPETGEEEILHRVFEFALQENNDRPAVVLSVYSSDPRTVRINAEVRNGYWSEVVFQGVTEVNYNPKYRVVEFRRDYGNGYLGTLKVWWRGQFDIIVQ